MFDAWAHEQGLDNMTRARYTPQELARLQLGYLRREHEPQQSGGSAGNDNVEQQKRKLLEGHRKAREEQFKDLGFQ